MATLALGDHQCASEGQAITQGSLEDGWMRELDLMLALLPPSVREQALAHPHLSAVSSKPLLQSSLMCVTNVSFSDLDGDFDGASFGFL